jgi:hypothetical protein
MNEFVVAGLLMSPFVKYALLALLLFIPLHVLLVRTRVHRWFWHPLLAEAAAYICLLALLNLFFP